MISKSVLRLAARASILAAALLLPHTLAAQNFERVVEGIPVERNGQMLSLPFVGGLDIFLPQFVDIDADGDFDLFISQPEESSPRLSLFENTGTPQAHHFRLNSSPFDTMSVNSWFYFVDIDADGDFDFYHADGRNGLRFRRNIGSPAQARFILEAASVVDVTGFNVVSEYTSIPAFVDIDADGDYDFFYGNVLGYIVLYRNIGDARTPAFFFETDFWQELKIVSSGGLLAPATTTTPPFILPEEETHQTIPPSRGVSLASSEKFVSYQHGANGIAFDDLDHDGDQDLFYGDLFHRSVYFLRNDGSAQNPAVAITDTTFPQPQPVATLGHNIPRFADIDADGDDDFFVAGLRQIQNNFLFYRNVGEATRPQLKSATQIFLPALDAGSYSVPAFGDLDGDGDLDMLLGNFDGQFVYYENRGTPRAPSLYWITDTFQNLRLDFFATSSPEFVDIDHDGDLDLFAGSYSGRLAFFENRGASRSPNFVLNTSNFAGIDVGNASAPFFADGDRDGDFDLYVGENFAGLVNIFENTGSAQQPVFSADPQKVLAHAMPSDDAVPCLLDFDGDGFLDLFIGQRAGKILHYRGTAALDSFELVSSAFENIDVGLNSAPRFVDWDNDGKWDLIVGEQAGGLNYYRALTGNDVKSSYEVPASFSLHAYPNPFAERVTVVLHGQAARFSEAPRLRVYNLIGEIIAEIKLQNAGTGTWHAQWLPEAFRTTRGIYFVEAKWKKLQITRKIFYQHR